MHDTKRNYEKNQMRNKTKDKFNMEIDTEENRYAHKGCKSLRLHHKNNNWVRRHVYKGESSGIPKKEDIIDKDRTL